jgi:hypothetical protein
MALRAVAPRPGSPGYSPAELIQSKNHTCVRRHISQRGEKAGLLSPAPLICPCFSEVTTLSALADCCQVALRPARLWRPAGTKHSSAVNVRKSPQPLNKTLTRRKVLANDWRRTALTVVGGAAVTYMINHVACITRRGVCQAFFQKVFPESNLRRTICDVALIFAGGVYLGGSHGRRTEYPKGEICTWNFLAAFQWANGVCWSSR